QINVDRVAAARLGLTQTDTVRNVIAVLMSSAQLAPNFWIDPGSGNPYIIGVQYPQHLVESIRTLENIPLSSERGRNLLRVPLLKDVARIERTQGPIEIYHHDIDRVDQLLVNVNGNDLAGVAGEVERLVGQLARQYVVSQLSEPRKELAESEDFLRELEVY